MALAALAPLGAVVLLGLVLDLRLWAIAFLAATLLACAVVSRRFAVNKADSLPVSGARS